MVITQPKQSYVVRSLPFEYWSIWIPDKHSVRYSDESGIWVSSIQMVTVLIIVNHSYFILSPKLLKLLS